MMHGLIAHSTGNSFFGESLAEHIMIETEYCPLATTLAAQLRAEREGLITRWLERIADRVEIRLTKDLFQVLFQ